MNAGLKARDLTDLLLLAAIWGSGFWFMRLAVPAFGPMALAFVRVALAFVRVAGTALVLGLWPRRPAPATA